MYWVWQAMLDRCRNPRNPAYPNYGGREDPTPITVDEYYCSFENYYADVGDKPSLGLSVDRTNNDRGYEPGNLRWANRHTQRINQRPRKARRSSVAEIHAYAAALAVAKKAKP